MALQSRRGFLSDLGPVVGGAVVASALAGCAVGSDEDAGQGGLAGGSPAQWMAYRPVQLRPGMRYQNVMPRTVPAVRLRGAQG